MMTEKDNKQKGFSVADYPDLLKELEADNPPPMKSMRVKNSAWVWGWTLDDHTVSSDFISYDPSGTPLFENRYTAVGLLLYHLKYKNDKRASDYLLGYIFHWLLSQKKQPLPQLDMVIPVPPSVSKKAVTAQLAKGIAQYLNHAYDDSAITKKATPQLKGITDPAERQKILSKAFSANPKILAGKHILLVDDLFRSGATLEAIARVACEQGKAQSVSVFAVTRTRVNR